MHSKHKCTTTFITQSSNIPKYTFSPIFRSSLGATIIGKIPILRSFKFYTVLRFSKSF